MRRGRPISADSLDPQAQAQQQLRPTQVQPNPNRHTMPAPSKLLSQPWGPPVPLQTNPKDVFLLSPPNSTATGPSYAHSSSAVVGGPSAAYRQPPIRWPGTANNGLVSVLSWGALTPPSPALPSPGPPTAKNLESMNAEGCFPSIEELENLDKPLYQVASSSYRAQRRSPSLTPPLPAVPRPIVVLADKTSSPLAMPKRDWLTRGDLGHEAVVNPQRPQPPHNPHQHPHSQRMNLGPPEVGGHYLTPVGTMADPDKGTWASVAAMLVALNGKQTLQGRAASPPPFALPPRTSASREPSPAPTGQMVDNWSPVDARFPHWWRMQDSSEYEDAPENIGTDSTKS